MAAKPRGEVKTSRARTGQWCRKRPFGVKKSAICSDDQDDSALNPEYHIDVFTISDSVANLKTGVFS